MVENRAVLISKITNVSSFNVVDCESRVFVWRNVKFRNWRTAVEVPSYFPAFDGIHDELASWVVEVADVVDCFSEDDVPQLGEGLDDFIERG
jgi:hypothetical protein